MTRGRPISTIRSGADGQEKRCSRCQEWWPADREFFHGCCTKPLGLADWCRACYGEWRADKRKASATPSTQLTFFLTSGAVDAIPLNSDRRFFALKLE